MGVLVAVIFPLGLAASLAFSEHRRELDRVAPSTGSFWLDLAIRMACALILGTLGFLAWWALDTGAVGGVVAHVVGLLMNLAVVGAVAFLAEVIAALAYLFRGRRVLAVTAMLLRDEATSSGQGSQERPG